MVELPKLLRDAAYIGVGFGVLAFQKAQVRRRELARLLAARCAPPATAEPESRPPTDAVP
ncbi:MAG: hypothetical protein M3P53_06455 [Actinomycetota bacterium]|nr:hypothetical protein [Actinomycetota bacterium]